MGVLFATKGNRSSLSRAAAEGELRRLARGIYTDELDRSDEAVVQHHRWKLVAHLVPDAVIVDRSSASGGTPAKGVLFVASSARSRDVELPGLRIAVRRGPRLPSDQPWAEGLSIASPARTLVDNIALSRGRDGVARTLSDRELGDWVARQARLLGPTRLNRIRDEAKDIALDLGVPERSPAIDTLVGAALGTSASPVRSRALTARAAGSGFDEDRAVRFKHLASTLAALTPSEEVPDSLPVAPEEELSSLGFWEAYFSNHIEGTVFPVEQAEEIVATGLPPVDRPADGHDILGTHRVVTDPVERSRVPQDAEDLYEILTSRHAEIMAGRPELGPGQWKRERNQVGSHIFVEPNLVLGTLAEGLSHRTRITSPFGRAIYMFFVIAEVHPFSDGNGRVARTIMNAELSEAGETRILVPIVWREEYFRALRLLSRDDNEELYVRTLAFAWRWTAAMNWADPPSTAVLLDRTNALVDSVEASETGRRLLLP